MTPSKEGRLYFVQSEAKVGWLLEVCFLNECIKDSWAAVAISLSDSKASVVHPGDASRIW